MKWFNRDLVEVWCRLSEFQNHCGHKIWRWILCRKVQICDKTKFTKSTYFQFWLVKFQYLMTKCIGFLNKLVKPCAFICYFLWNLDENMRVRLIWQLETLVVWGFFKDNVHFVLNSWLFLCCHSSNSTATRVGSDHILGRTTVHPP